MSGASEEVRLHQIGAGLTRRLTPDADSRARIARSLDLAALDAFEADLNLAPVDGGWKLSGRVKAEAVQTCGLTLEPLPVSVDQAFSVRLTEKTPDETDDEIIVDPEAEDAPDLVEEGRIDLMQYAIEQLALSLDPFPRKPGAVFVQPEGPGVISPFAALAKLKGGGNNEGG